MIRWNFSEWTILDDVPLQKAGASIFNYVFVSMSTDAIISYIGLQLF